MKVLNMIKKIFIGILGVAFFGFVLVMTILLLNYNKYGVSEIDGNSFIIVRDDISSTTYKKGDLVLVKQVRLDSVNAGDEIFSYKLDSITGTVSIEVGKASVISNTNSDQSISFQNGDTYSKEFIVGKATAVYNNIGTYLGIVLSKWGFLFTILVPSLLVFIYELYALIVEIKYGREEIAE